MAGRKKAWEILVCLHLLIEEKRDRVIVSIVKQPDMALSYSRTAAKESSANRLVNEARQFSNQGQKQK